MAEKEIHTRIPFCDLQIDRQEIYRAMGYREEVPEIQFREMVETMLEELAGLCRPQGLYRIYDGQVVDSGHIEVGQISFRVGKIIAPCFDKAEQFAGFVTTAGQEYDGYVKELKAKEDMVSVFMADAIGSVIAEACVTEVIKRLEKQIPLRHTYPYSPGYCGWNVKEQAALFQLLPENPCGVKLTDSCLMLPVKSVSGVIGLGDEVENKPYGCAICMNKNCYKRRVQ